METMNVVIGESSNSGFEKVSRNSPKKFFLLSPKKFKKLFNKSPYLQVLPVLSVMEDSVDISTSPDFDSHEEKGPSSRIKLNRSPEVIMET